MAKLILLVGAGGGIGTILRYLVFRWLGFSLNGFPLSTFFVNLLGCFLIGVWTKLNDEDHGDREYDSLVHERHETFLCVVVV